MTGSATFHCSLLSSANFFVAALYNTSDISTVLESIQVPKGSGYEPEFQVTFTYNLQQDVVYRVILWESPDSNPNGVSRVSGDIKASLNSIKLRAPLYLIADVSAGFVSGTNTYVDATLDGWDFWIDINGSGPAFPGTGLDYTYDSATTTITSLLGNWQNEQRMVIFFQPQVSAAPQPPVSAIQTGRIITINTTLTSADKNKALWVRAAGQSIAINLMALSSLADYDRVVIYSAGGNHVNLVINTQGTDKIQLDTQVTKIVLGQAEKLELVKANGQFEVDYLSPSYYMVGEIITRYSKGEVNTIFADGCVTAGLLQRSVYVRLTDLLLSGDIPPGAIATEATWNNTTTADGLQYYINRGKWTLGDGSTTIRVPQLYDTGFIRAVDGSIRSSGSYELPAIMDHKHNSLIGEFPGDPNGNGPSGTVGRYNGTQTAKSDLSSPPGRIISGTFAAFTRRDNSENRPGNTGAYLSIRI